MTSKEKSKKAQDVSYVCKKHCFITFLVTGGFLFVYSMLRLPQKDLLHENASCSLRPEEKFDCHPESGANEKSCLSRGCCWLHSDDKSGGSLSEPSCYYPHGSSIYKYLNMTQRPGGASAFYKLTQKSAYPKDVELLRMDLSYQNENRLRIKIYDPMVTRYESLYPKIPESNEESLANNNYLVEIDNINFGFNVLRADKTSIFNSLKIGGFIFSDQFLQISASFSGSIFGLGERQGSFQLNTNWNKVVLFNRDGIPVEKNNLYGSHPFYMVVDSNGLSHGVYLHNSNAMEIILQPLPAITFRTIGGVLDFYFFMGPTPTDVIRQYTNLVGRPAFPPFWSLGYHLCRLGYKNTSHVEEVFNRTVKAGIPLDAQWVDIDYMRDRNDFTLDNTNFKNLPTFVEKLKKSNVRFVPILDPGISASEPKGAYEPYDQGLQLGIFIKNSDGSIFVGKVWNRNSTVFPDFTNRKTFAYWTGLIRKFNNVLPFDGLWIDMNEPANFLDGSIKGCPASNLETPPYIPEVVGQRLYSKTVCMTAQQFGGSHYNVHNLYGISEADATHSALIEILKKRPFIISRSTFPGSGKYAGHWSGDVVSTWHDMRMSVSELLSFSIFGVPMMGSDICGFNGNTTKYLCLRWSQLGAFYPFSRNHNTDDAIDQDPVAMGEEVASATRSALQIRYSLLPYLYTYFWRAHRFGDTVARPLFFEYSSDIRTHSVDYAFLWGDYLLIVPVLEEFQTTVTVYLPQGRWYDWYTYLGLESQGNNVTLPAPTSQIPILIRGGGIIIKQGSALNTFESRKTPFTLLCAFSSNLEAYGFFYWDDGESIGADDNASFGQVNFVLNSTKLRTVVKYWHNTDAPCLNVVHILGFVKPINHVYLNSTVIPHQWNTTSLVLTLNDLCIPIQDEFEITWSAN